MPGTKVRFHFDYLSPYSYVAWHQLKLFAQMHGLQVEAMPTLLPALLKHHGQKGPAEIPPKRLYVFKDCVRRAAVLGVPFAPPFSHPFNPLLALRVSGLPMDEGARARLVTDLFAATWADGRDVSAPGVVTAVCKQAGVPNAVERASTPEAKQRLKDVTAAAIELGVFGVPTMLVEDELFWGTDSFEHFERYLCGEDPVRGADLSAWERVRASAARRE